MGKERSMNRFIKGILYITAGCIGIGCAALIIGVVLGGGSQVLDMSFGQVKNRVRDFVMTADKEAHNQMTGHGSEAVIVDHSFDKEYADDFIGNIGIFTADASSIEKLAIDLRYGSLSIEESEDSRVVVSVDGPADGVEASCSSGVLTIQDVRTGKKAREDACVYLQIPEGMQLSGASIRVDSGAVDMEGSFYAKELSVDAGAGEISLMDVTADTFTASVGAGTLDISDSSFQTANFNCGVGTMDIDADIKGDAQIDCGMGEIYMELERDITSVNYVLECGAGSIQIGDSTYSGIAKKSQFNNGADATFTVSCGMGQIYID